MNRSESKYFSTAVKMDEAFIGLLAEKEFQYITVKEICQRAGVHRSTFYLHYETMADLLNESVEYIMGNFSRHFEKEPGLPDIENSPLEELLFIEPSRLLPYLSYIRDNKRLFRISMEQAAVLNLQSHYEKMFRHIFDPIMERFQVPSQERRYTMTFYIHGITALVMEWLKNDCRESVEDIADIIMRNITGPEGLQAKRGLFNGIYHGY